jgi:predicted O-methyltransferase YrrM
VIPGWFDFADLYDEMVARVPDGQLAFFVECGTYLGASAAHMGRLLARHPRKLIYFTTIDNWSGVNGEDPAVLEAAARKNLEPYTSDWFWVITGDCLEHAPDLYGDDALDFVFLDDDHSEAHVLAEIRAWWPKIRPGGVLAGHDFTTPSVIRALDAWGTPYERASTNCWRARKPAASVEAP